MDLNVNALVHATYLIPIAITLRKIYSPCFDTPEPIAAAVAKVDAQRCEAHRPGTRQMAEAVGL